MKRNDIHKSDAVTFSWPEMEDDEHDIITEPTTIGDTIRTADKLSVEFDFAHYETMLF